MMPLLTIVSMTGWASLNAAAALVLSPALIAVSTFLTDVRKRERAATLWARRLTDCLARFSADLMFATDESLLERPAHALRGWRKKSRAFWARAQGRSIVVTVYNARRRSAL